MESRGFPSGSVVKNPPGMQETQETWVQSLGHQDSLEEGMATYTGILTWEIPWREEPGRLQSIGRKESDMTKVTEYMHGIEKNSTDEHI